MLDAVAFEPGPWQSDAPLPVPAEVPSTSRDPFRTPAGLLLNELRRSPEQLTRALLEMGRNALELDPGRRRDRAQIAPEIEPKCSGDLDEI